MKKVTRSVIKLSELPQHLREDDMFIGHKIHTYAEYHIDDLCDDPLSLWLIENYPTIKQKISFLIHIDTDPTKAWYPQWVNNFVYFMAGIGAAGLVILFGL
jgi:hypothetical protein